MGRLLTMPRPIDLRHVTDQKVTVAERLVLLRRLLRRGRFSFDQATERADRVTVAVTLFALLELYKQGEATWTQDEPFGPIAVSRSFETFDEVIGEANRLPFGLAAFAFTENGRRSTLIGDLVESGMVGINTFAISGADTPFGGVKDSGFGSEGGKEGLESYQVVKAIHQA